MATRHDIAATSGDRTVYGSIVAALFSAALVCHYRSMGSARLVSATGGKTHQFRCGAEQSAGSCSVGSCRSSDWLDTAATATAKSDQPCAAFWPVTADRTGGAEARHQRAGTAQYNAFAISRLRQHLNRPRTNRQKSPEMIGFIP
jgi:hypothetical protein